MKNSRSLRISARCVAALLLGLVFEAGAQTPQVRIMPVGDSITDGAGSAPLGGGYRLPLWQMLTNAGYAVDYVGLQTSTSSAQLPDSHHEGHSGWKINQIYSNMVNLVFGATEDPDALLLMIGTNDFGQNYDVNNATNRLDQLIGLLTTNWPHCKVIVASLTKRGEPYNTNIQTNYNNSVPVIVAQHAANGEQVYFTDMYTAVPLDAANMPDNLHPNTNGYIKMATNWFPALTNLIGPLGTTNAPALARVAAVFGFSNVLVKFSKPVDDASATNLLNYFVDGGLSLLGATLETNKRTVTLTTTPQAPLTTYTLIVTGVTDRTAAQTLITPAVTNFSTGGTVLRGVSNNVPAATNYALVYSLDIPNAPNYTGGVPYNVDRHTFAQSFSRVAYYLELQTNGGPVDYIWVSFDALSSDVNAIGVPTFASGAAFQQPLTNMDVLSSVAGVVTGSGLSGGNIEFWPQNYNPGNTAGVLNASSTAYDWGDNRTNGGNYGSMQVHNHDASQVLFAFNHWNAGTGADLGIGNRPASTDADWTFANNSSAYTVKTLQVYALLANDATPPALTDARATGFTGVTLSFSEALADSATNPSYYAINGGISVLAASLDATNKDRVTLTTSPMSPSMWYTATVNNVRDTSTNQNVIATNSTIAFQTPRDRGAYSNVAEVVDYQLVYSLNISNASAMNSQGVPYDVDLRNHIGTFDRVAYYLELQTNNGLLDYMWVSLDPFTNSAAKIGVPANPGGPVFQRYVSNLTIQSSVSGILQATNLATGGMEFWPWDYSASNAVPFPNASHTQFDWGDRCSTNAGGYGCMQIHNWGANLGATTGQVLFAFNNWGGNGGNNGLGIGNGTAPNLDWTFANNAANFTVKTLQVYARPTVNPPLQVAEVAGRSSLSNVVILFTKPVIDTAGTLTNFSIAGLTLYSAVLDPVSKTKVTLTTSPQTPSTLYTLTIGGGVFDRTPSALPLTGGPAYSFMSLARGGALNNVPEAGGYTLVYQLVLSNAANYSSVAPAYSVDNHFGATNYDRIAYYLELVRPNGPTNFLWVSMDAFSPDAGRIGVPVNASGAFFQQPLTNLSVLSSVFGVLNGTNLGGGNIEFWPTSYTTANSAGVPGASGGTYDWGDQPTAGNYGSMQIHNGGAGQVLLAFNNWGAGGVLDLGIGNNLGNAHADWTFMNNANTYTSKFLQVYVRPLPDVTAPTVVSAVASPDRTRVLVTFSEPLADGAANVANFAIDNGIVVGAAVLSNNLRQITLTVSQLAGGATYTLTVNNVRDRSAAANLIAANSTAVITTAPLPAHILANAPEAADYQMAYVLPLPAFATNWNVNGTPYSTDNRNVIGPYSRVAYYIELATNAGPTNWVWVSMDAFTNDVNKIAMPDMALAGGPIIQQRVSNLTVITSATNLTGGTNMPGGNIEFCPFNYAAANALGIPNASATTYDFGDTMSPTYGLSGHACMQVHNHGATQVVFAIDHWGANGNLLELGIGNQPTGNPDWTFANNGTNYTFKNLYVMVKPYSDTNGPQIARVQATPDLAGVLVTFNQPLDEASTNAANFSIGGLTVNSASLRPNLRDILLATSPQAPDTTYTLTVSNVRDRTTNSTVMPLAVATNFTALSLAQIAANVPETTNLTLVYGLALPSAVPNYNLTGVVYGVDLRPLITQNFNRVAYYLELATNGGATNWVYVSTAAFNTNVNRIGVPVLGSGAGFQQKLATNATVYSSDAGITTGTNINTLSIEFWPFNTTAATSAVVTGGTSLNFDWNDSYNTGGQYGSMQIHNYAAGQTLFAFNRWGAGQTGAADLGIGNTPGTTNTDWTFSQSATNYATKNLYVFVRLTNAPAAAAPAVLPPAIVTHPASRTNVQNTAAILAGLASGSTPISYQWRRNGAPLAGQVNSWLAFASVQFSDAGSYDLIASNAAGVVTSLVAVLSVTNAPPPGGYDAWAAQITNGLTNDTDSALGDGYPNLLKYATGSNPTNADGRAHIHPARTNGAFALRFNHDTNATDITLIVEGADSITNGAAWLGIATNLGGSWGGSANVAENTATQPAGVTVQDGAVAATNRFLRLRVTRP